MIKKALPHLISIFIIVLINVTYFFPQLQGKVVQQSDIVSSEQSTRTLKAYSLSNGKDYLWNPAEFGGMPILASPPSKNNLIYEFYRVLKLGFDEPIGMFIAGSLLSYLCLILLGFNPWVSLIFSFPAMFVTGNLILWDAGHNSKIRTLLFTPLLIAGVLNIFEYRKYFLGFLLLSIGFAFSFYTRHPQMTFYVLLVFMIYGIIVFINTIRQRDWNHFLKGTLLVAFAIVLGLCTSATRTWSMYDYSKVTMRGDPILLNDNLSNDNSSSKVKGLSWDYANQWSNGVIDIIALAIPGAAGGGSGEEVDINSASYKNYRIRNAPLYWGKLPFNVGPLYLGASIIFLFVLGLFLVKGNIKWWLGVGIIWMIFLSMGKNFEFLNRLMFDYFPFYSKFRAPQTVLNTSSFFVVILAASTVNSLFSFVPKKKSKKKTNSFSGFTKSLIISLVLCGGITIFMALFGTSIFDFSYMNDINYKQQGINIEHFISDRKALFSKDAWRSFIIILSLAVVIYAFLKDRLNKYFMLVIIGFIILIDLSGIGLRYLNHNNFVKKIQYKQNFVERPVDLEIAKLEVAKHTYRVHDLTIPSFQSSKASAHHNTIGGASAIKMQRVQDLIDVHLSKNNMQVLNMLNAKYFIVPGENKESRVQSNPGALGNAWFVSSVRLVDTPNDELNALTDTDLRTTAVLLKTEFPGYSDSISNGVDPNGIITITSYEPDKIEYVSSSQKGGLAVFSEMWYGPDKGWQAYIDGVPVNHIRVNYALRALKIPLGSHNITFEFKPKSFYIGETISLISSFILMGIIGFFIFSLYKNNSEMNSKNKKGL